MGLNPDGESTFSTSLPVDKPSLSTGLFSHKRTITKAVIIAAGNGSRLQGYQGGCPKPLVKVGGVPLLERVIRSAKRIGVTEFVIVIGYQAARIRKTINSKKLGVKITWVRNLDWRRPNGISVLKAEKFVGERFLLFMSDHVFDPKILEKIEKVELGDDAGVLCVDYALNRVQNLDDATKVRTEHNRMVNLGKSLTDFNAIDVGIFVCTPDLFDALRQSQDRGNETLSGGVQVLAEEGRMRTFNIGDSFWQDVDTIPDAYNAERLLLKATRSSGDGIIARKINRKISNFITRGLLKIPITPNQISIFNLVFSIFVAWLVSFGKPITTVIGGLLFQLSSILDGCDGEVAIIKLKDSKKGASIDTITDHLSYFAFVIGLTVGAFNATGEPLVFVATGVAMMGLLFALNLGRLYAKKKGTTSLRVLDQGIASLNHPNQKVWYLRLFGMIHHMGRRDMFAFCAMLVMVVSADVLLIYWMVIGFLLVVDIGVSISCLTMLSKSETTKNVTSVRRVFKQLFSGLTSPEMKLRVEQKPSE